MSIEFQPLRVRCVDAAPADADWPLREGAEYVVLGRTSAGRYVRLKGIDGEFYEHRFKPVVRVKAKCIVSFDLLVKRAKAKLDRMTPEEQALHWQAQRESWVRGQVGWD